MWPSFAKQYDIIGVENLERAFSALKNFHFLTWCYSQSELMKNVWILKVNLTGFCEGNTRKRFI